MNRMRKARRQNRIRREEGHRSAGEQPLITMEMVMRDLTYPYRVFVEWRPSQERRGS